MPENEQTDIPKHLAIVMDGNGRWATSRGRGRRDGHKQGVETLRTMVREIGGRGVKYLTVFSFSTQNWGRPQTEVDFLMTMLQRYIESDLADLHAEGVRIRVLGRRQDLNDKLIGLIDRAEELTAGNSKLYLQIAFNYGAREELADAASRLARRAAAGTLDPMSITPEVLDSEMLTAGLPDPDLIVRTSGEYRLSNFLLWQSAYSEFYFTDVLWPDFNIEELDRALETYAGRQRRFGLTGAQVAPRK